MPHQRHRHLNQLTRKLLGMSPLVGILGHRQVGKTTLLEQLTKKYHTFDDANELLEAQTSAANYLKNRAGHWVALDECQMVESLFPALKEYVRKNPRPGQFLLSGSVRFTSRNAIQESLTGRIVNLELLPLLLSELRSESLPDFWRRAVHADVFSRDYFKNAPVGASESALNKYLEVGGLPGICFIREAAFRSRKFDSQFATILDRDLRKVAPTNIPYPQLRMLVQILADRQGECLSWTELRSAADISIPTLKKLLFGLEAVFIIRSVLVEGDVKGPVFFFEDVGELGFLRSRPLTPVEKMVHVLMVHMRGEMSYGFTEAFQIAQYRTRAGVLVPLVLHAAKQSLGVVPISGDTPTRAESAAGDSFLKRFNRSKVLFVHPGTRSEVLDERRAITSLRKTL